MMLVMLSDATVGQDVPAEFTGYLNVYSVTLVLVCQKQYKCCLGARHLC